jgi:membrane-associated protease RseP (regulator of RpoE activity)
MRSGGDRTWIHALLFALTCASTYYTGGGGREGAIFAGTLMTILVCHEMAHYLAARRHGIDVSLPYFIPLPLIGIGTLGAVIRMRSPIQRRDALADVGASGPLAGLAVAIPLLVIGLWQSPVVHITEEGLIEGNSILYAGLKLLVKGQILPTGGLGEPMVDVQLGPMAMAAWVGLLVTFINLIPIGQLDGGHIAVALFGNRHERLAPWLHRGLAVVGGVVFAALAAEAYFGGREVGEAIGYGAAGALPWVVWVGLLLLMRKMGGGVYHPPVGPEPLSAGRRRLCWLAAVVFLLLFTPVPMREALL